MIGRTSFVFAHIVQTKITAFDANTLHLCCSEQEMPCGKGKCSNFGERGNEENM